MDFNSMYQWTDAYAQGNWSELDPYLDEPQFLPLFNDSLFNGSSRGNDSMLPEGAQGGMSSVLIPIIYIVVCVIGLGGNTLVIHIVLHYSKTESVTNIYILNLAIADELFMLSLPFLAVQTALHAWAFGSLMCRLVMIVDAINQFTSIFCLTVMSIDRYLAVVHPIRSARWRRPQVAKVVNATVWLLSFAVALPVVIFAGVNNGHCNILWPDPAHVWRTAFIVFASVMGFFFPLLVISLCYLLIVIKIRSSGKKVHATSTKRRKSERKVTRMVVIVVAVFVLCWLPFYALNILNLMIRLPMEPKGLYYFVVVLQYINSCANPIIYGFMSDNFKQGFRKALCRSSRRIDNHEAAAQHGRQRAPQDGALPQQQQLPLEDEEQELQRRRLVLLPRESLRRTIRGEPGEDEEEDEDEDDEVTEMTEICRITQNGNASRQPEEAACALLSEKVSAISAAHEFASPDKRGSGAGDGPVRGPSFGAAGPALLNGPKNGSVKPLPEEPVEKNALLEISYL